MSGINLVTNGDGVKTGILIDINTLKQQHTSGRSVIKYLTSLEDIEDIIDVELNRNEASDDWATVKMQFRMQGKSKRYIHPIN